MDFNEDMVTVVIVVGCLVMALAMRSLRRNRGIVERMNVWERRTGGQYGTGIMRPPWFSTPFFLIFVVLVFLAWLVFG